MAPLVIIFTYLNLCASFQRCLTAFWSRTIILVCMYILLFTSDHKHPIINIERDSLIHLHIFPAFFFLATQRAVMITTIHRKFISWWHLEVLEIPSSLFATHFPGAEADTLSSMWRVTGEKGLLELDVLLLQHYVLSISVLTILLVLLHLWMADGCTIRNLLSACTHSVCLACPARWLGFGSTRCSCWDCWLEKHLPPEPVN